ncbi:hypothetical protein D3C77_106010 [compost metagenome]
MSLIAEVYASGGPEPILHTLEISSTAWPEPILLVMGYEDRTLIDENGFPKTYQAAAFNVSLPERNNSGNQSLQFAIDNVDGTAQRRIDEALAASAEISMTYRPYLRSRPSAPASKPLKYRVLGGSIEGSEIRVDAGFHDTLNTRWPRRLYTVEFAPGLTYMT